MRLARIEADDFLAYDRLELDLSSVEQLAIVGPVGSGKSSLLDAARWSVWGRSRAASADDLIRHGESTCRVATEWEIDDRLLRVTRWRSKKGRGESSLNVQVDGRDVTKHTIGETQELIDGLVGVPEPLVTAGPVMVQGRSDELMRMEPRDRKELLFRMLGLDRYEKLRQSAREHLTTVNGEAMMLARESAALDPPDEVMARRLVHDAQKAHEALAGESGARFDELRDTQDEATAIVERSKQRESLQQTMDRERRRMERLTYESAVAAGLIEKGAAAKPPQRPEIRSADDCPALAEYEVALDRHEVGQAEAEAASKRLLPLGADLDEATRAFEEARAGLLRIDQDEARQQQVAEMLVAQTQAWRQAEAQERAAAQRYEVAVLSEKTWAAQRQRKAVIELEIARLAADEEVWQLLEKAFGRDGIPTMVMEEALPQIEERANGLLAAMPTGFQLALQTQRETRTTGGMKETLEVALLSADGFEQAYALASGGEKMQVDLALRIALASLVRFGTLWVDEGWGSQDKAGREALVQGLLGATSEFPLVIAVSHVEDVADRFAARLQVTKAGGTSRVSL